VAETGHDGKNTPGHNRTPIVRTVITLTEKGKQKKRQRLLSLTDTKIKQFRIITVILVVNEASNWQN
jgi:hypothetical protein